MVARALKKVAIRMKPSPFRLIPPLASPFKFVTRMPAVPMMTASTLFRFSLSPGTRAAAMMTIKNEPKAWIIEAFTP